MIYPPLYAAAFRQAAAQATLAETAPYRLLSGHRATRPLLHATPGVATDVHCPPPRPARLCLRPACRLHPAHAATCPEHASTGSSPGPGPAIAAARRTRAADRPT